MTNTIVNIALRAFQLFCSFCVLGLSVGLIKGQGLNTSAPISLKYAAFVGGLTLVGGLVGLASEWVSRLQGKIMLLLDAIIMVVNLAGGVLLAILIGGAKCSDSSDRNRDKLKDNDLFNGGKFTSDKKTIYWNWIEGREKYLNSRCKESQADSVFMFFAFAALLACATMTYLRMKKGY